MSEGGFPSQFFHRAFRHASFEYVSVQSSVIPLHSPPSEFFSPFVLTQHFFGLSFLFVCLLGCHQKSMKEKSLSSLVASQASQEKEETRVCMCVCVCDVKHTSATAVRRSTSHKDFWKQCVRRRGNAMGELWRASHCASLPPSPLLLALASSLFCFSVASLYLCVCGDVLVSACPLLFSKRCAFVV